MDAKMRLRQRGWLEHSNNLLPHFAPSTLIYPSPNIVLIYCSGYMPPEYTIDGLFSVKSDVFSFGVLMLEIVSGKRNRGFNHPDHHHNLLGHVRLPPLNPMLKICFWLVFY